MSAANYRLTLSGGMDEPAPVPTGFDLLRIRAKACGLSDVDKVSIHLGIEVSLRVYEGQAEELRVRLEALWFGEMPKCDIIEPRAEAAE